MQVKEIMSEQLTTASAEDTIADVAKKMRDANVGCVVVTNRAEIKGIITDRDITISCASEGDDPEECKVADHMSEPVFTIAPDAEVLDAAQFMTEKEVKRLPVAEGGRLVGLLSFSDIAEAMAEPMNSLLMGFGAARRAA